MRILPRLPALMIAKIPIGGIAGVLTSVVVNKRFSPGYINTTLFQWENLPSALMGIFASLIIILVLDHFLKKWQQVIEDNEGSYELIISGLTGMVLFSTVGITALIVELI